MIYIEEEKLAKLLTKAYEEGWYGSKDLAEEVAGKIILDFINENPKPKKAVKKKAVRKKMRVGSVYDEVHDRSVSSIARNNLGGGWVTLNQEAASRFTRTLGSHFQCGQHDSISMIDQAPAPRRTERPEVSFSDGWDDDHIEMATPAIDPTPTPAIGPNLTFGPNLTLPYQQVVFDNIDMHYNNGMEPSGDGAV